jgi:hypothetical protein
MLAELSIFLVATQRGRGPSVTSLMIEAMMVPARFLYKGELDKSRGRRNYGRQRTGIDCRTGSYCPRCSEQPQTAEAELIFPVLRRAVPQHGEVQVFCEEGIRGMPSQLVRV